jgi:hypothetical protein
MLQTPAPNPLTTQRPTVSQPQQPQADAGVATILTGLSNGNDQNPSIGARPTQDSNLGVLAEVLARLIPTTDKKTEIMKTLNKDELNKIPDLREADLSSMPMTVEFFMAVEQVKDGDNYSMCMSIVKSRAAGLRIVREIATQYLTLDRCTTVDWLAMRRELLTQAFGDDFAILERARRDIWEAEQPQGKLETIRAYESRMTEALNRYEWITLAVGRPVHGDWGLKRIADIIKGFKSVAARTACFAQNVITLKRAIFLANGIEKIDAANATSQEGAQRSLNFMDQQQGSAPHTDTNERQEALNVALYTIRVEEERDRTRGEEGTVSSHCGGPTTKPVLPMVELWQML